MNKHLYFIRRFLRDPRRVGAVAPSSATLARAMLARLDLVGARAVVEFGPGLGAFTGRVLAGTPREADYVAIEKDPAFARILAAEHPRVRVVTGDARRAPAILEELGVGPVDAVVSGLPFANFPRPLQEEILRGVDTILRPGGCFVTFSYIHTWPLGKARRFRRLAASIFPRVEWKAVMRNFPPAFVVACHRAPAPTAPAAPRSGSGVAPGCESPGNGEAG